MRTYVKLGLLLAVVLALAVLAGGGAPAYAWSDPAALNSNAATDSGHDYSPQVTTDGGGHWVAVWRSNENVGGTIETDYDILVARSTDNGDSWTVPAALNSNATSDSGDDWHPQVATDGGGNWVAVWESEDDLMGTIETDYDILVARSTDDGVTWTAPVALNTNASSDSGHDWQPQVTTDGGGNWCAVWYSDDSLGDTIWTDKDILVACSSTEPSWPWTWTAPVALNTNADTDSGNDGNPEVTTDGGGNWVVVWESEDDLMGTIETDYDILVARSTDDGASWTAPVVLNTNAASDAGHDYTPQLTTDRTGNWVVVWYSDDSLGETIETDNDILVARSTTQPTWPWIWTAPAALNSNAPTDSGHDNDPQVTTNGGGKWVAAWESAENVGGTIETDYDILKAESWDNGASWTAPVPLNTNADTDSGDDYDPQVTTDGWGNWVALWESDDTLGGTIETDKDILYSTDLDVPDNDCMPEDYEEAHPCLDPDVPDAFENPDGDQVAVVGGSYDFLNFAEMLAGTDPCVADPVDDTDGDEFNDNIEAVLGTDPLDGCPDTLDHDAWPPDLGSGTGCGKHNCEVNVLDVLCFKPEVGSQFCDGHYDRRYDFNADGAVNVLDILLYKPVINTSCANP